MENSLKNFGISDENPILIKAATTLTIFDLFEKQKEKDIEALKDQVAEKIFGQLHLFNKIRDDENIVNFLNKNLFNLIKGSFYFTVGCEVSLISSKLVIPYESISSQDLNPDQFAEVINSRWVGKGKVPLATLNFCKKPEQKWEEYKDKTVEGYFKLSNPVRD